MFSLRELIWSNMFEGTYRLTRPQLDAFLTTSTLGQVIPEFIEEFGENKFIDVVFSLSHNLFLNGFPESKMSAVSMDKNGNMKFQVNMYAQINVETQPGVWSNARNMYMTFVFKMKVATDDTNPSDKKITFTPKSIEMSQMKVTKSGGEDIEDEAMMIQSMANIQLEQT